MGEEETIGLKIVMKSFDYGYGKTSDPQFYQQKTSWCISLYCYVSDPDLEGVHKITFKCKTKHDKKVFHYVLVDADKVTNFAIITPSYLRKNCPAQVPTEPTTVM